jgi:hypothetical protein
MRLFGLIGVVAVALCLSGCFVSKKPLIGADKAAFPFTRIVYKEKNGKETQTITREGSSYVLHGAKPDQRIDLRFLPVGDGYYVGQLIGKDNQGATAILYAFLKVDFGKKLVESYNAVGSDSDVGPGLTKCGQDICIDSLDAYVAAARAKIKAGGKPDATYVIVRTELFTPG